MSTSWIYLLECQPYDPATASVKTVCFCNSLPDEAALGQTVPYRVRLSQAFTHETSVFDQNLPGGTQISSGSATLNNADGLLDYLLAYSWDGRDLVVKRGTAGMAYGSYTTEFTGSSLELTADRENLVLTIRDNSWKLAKPIQANTYAGTGGAEGGLDLMERRKPLLFGTGRNLSPVPVDHARLMFQVNDGVTASISQVFDQGVALGYYGDYADYTTLLNATLPPGFYGTALSQGFFKLGAKPVGEITVDAVGAYSTVTTLPELVASLIKDKATLTDADLDLTLFSEAAADVPYPFEGLYFGQPDVQIDEVVEAICASFNGFWFLTRAGKFAVRQFKFRTPAASIRAEDFGAVQKQPSPNKLYRVKANYSKNSTIQDPNSFTLPRQTLNGRLKDNKIYVPTAADGTGGVYTYEGEFEAYLNDTKVNELGVILFQSLSAGWLTIDAKGKITVADPGVDSATATLRASLGEYSVITDFTLVKSKNPDVRTLSISTDTTHFFYDDTNNPDPPSQFATLTASGSGITEPYTWSAVDNLGNVVPVAPTGTTAVVSLADVVNSPMVTWVDVTVATADGSSNFTRVLILHGEEYIASGLVNFNSSNDRISTPPSAPYLPVDGTAVDHALNTDGSCDLSFEWGWTGDEAEIDGFEVVLYSSTSAVPYTIGLYPASEQKWWIPADKRSYITHGIPCDRYYTWYVRAYRVVDLDISVTGKLFSAWVKSTVSAEDPYLPSSNVAFDGNVVGTIDGVPALDVQEGAGAANNGLNPDGSVKDDKVDTTAIVAGAISVPSTTSGPDTFISAGSTVDVVETGWLTVGDAAAGNAFVMAFGELDSGTTVDVGGRITLYADLGGGYYQVGTSAGGARTQGADTFSKMAILSAATITNATTVRFKLTVNSFTMPNAPGPKPFTFRSPQIVVMGTKR